MHAKAPSTPQKHPAPGFREEFLEFWRAVPGKGMFFLLLGAWVALFHWFGNSTLGYVETSSLFSWLDYAYSQSADDDHGYFIPLVVLGLLWWKRRTLMEIPKYCWWPALGLVALALVLHILGYMVQQTRISVVGFFLGVYGLSGLVWGYRWMGNTFFPFFLFAFCVPLATLSEPITFPLRLLATKITGILTDTVLGINVVCDGTRIYDPEYNFQYEVTAACSGIRSLTATLALALIFAFVFFQSWWRRGLVIASAFPLAVAGNVFRLTIIILAAEIWGQSAGSYVHDNAWLSLLPYVPALGGLLLISHWLREREPGEHPSSPHTPPVVSGVGQEA